VKLPSPFGGAPVATVRGEHGIVSIAPHSRDEVICRRLGADLLPVGEETEVIKKILLHPLTPAAVRVLGVEVETEVKEGLTVRATKQGEQRERGPRGPEAKGL